MFNMILGLFIIVMWGIALLSLIFTFVFRKRKTARRIFGVSALVFGLIPVLLFLVFWLFAANPSGADL